MSQCATMTLVQSDRYESFYGPLDRLRWCFRFDVRYRARRLHEVLERLGVDVAGKRVLDFGFGSGALLRSFPRDCALTGVDVSPSAVERARGDARYDAWSSAHFQVVPEADPDAVPAGPFDLIVTSHTLEHVPDDGATLRALERRLAPGGVLAVFVPLEEPDYIPFHARVYSLQSITERVRNAGLDPAYAEGSFFVNGHVWKVITIPSRRGWPVLGPVVDALRLSALSALPYRALMGTDRLLFRLGFDARQALVVARH